MMTCFDYVFYRTALLMRRLWHEEAIMERLRGMGMLTIFQFCNLAGISKLWKFTFGSGSAIGQVTLPVLLAVLAVLILFNSFRYLGKRKLKQCEARWHGESVRRKRLLGAVVIVYATVSLVMGVMRS